MIDPRDLERARAVLGLPLGASPEQLRVRHRELVKQWHPDRFANDPQGQEEATAKMRAINAAYQLLSDSYSAPARDSAPHTASPVSRAPGSRLTREQIDRLVGDIGTASPIQIFLDSIPIREGRDVPSTAYVPAGLGVVIALGTMMVLGFRGASNREVLTSCALGFATYFLLKRNARWWSGLANPDRTPRPWVRVTFIVFYGVFLVLVILGDLGILGHR